MTSSTDILKRLKTLANPEAVKGMARYGISSKNTYWVSIPNLRNMAKEVGVHHNIAHQLWVSKMPPMLTDQ